MAAAATGATGTTVVRPDTTGSAQVGKVTIGAAKLALTVSCAGSSTGSG